MRVKRSGRNTHVKFDALWESSAWLAAQNAAWFNYKAARRLYREAIKAAPESEKPALRERLAALKGLR